MHLDTGLSTTPLDNLIWSVLRTSHQRTGIIIGKNTQKKGGSKGHLIMNVGIMNNIMKNDIQIWNGAIKKKHHMKKNGFHIFIYIKETIIIVAASAVWRLTSTTRMRIVIIKDIDLMAKEKGNTVIYNRITIIKEYKIIKSQQD